jgi:hypothetical protein
MTDPTSLPAFEVPRQAGPGRQLHVEVVDALRDEGLEPGLDPEDGAIAVTVHDHTVLIRFFDTEPPMLRVLGQWLIQEGVEGDEVTRLRAANAVTGALNLVKVTVLQDRLTVAVDLVIGDGLNLRTLLVSTIDAVLGSANTWHATVTELLAEH